MFGLFKKEKKGTTQGEHKQEGEKKKKTKRLRGR